MNDNVLPPDYVHALERCVLQLEAAPAREELYQQIVDALFSDRLLVTSLDLGIVVLLLVNDADKMIDRVALSNTELAKGAVRASAKPFNKIRIPIEEACNAIAAAIRTGEIQSTEDWECLFTPALTGSQARRNQQAASIECSVVVP